jgi:3-deoxy-manno-octulosonate cytidylyltransferase (CMP-KDO synthetase)
MMVACVIPARYNSSRFPGKLLKVAGGKTVLQRTLEAARGADGFDYVCVATDDERIGDHVRALGGDVVWTRPECPNGTERVAEAVVKERRLQGAEIIVNLQGDHPLVRPETLSAVVEALRGDPEAQMATAATDCRDRERFLSPSCVKCVVDQKGRALYFSRAPIPFGGKGALHHVGIYAFRRPFLLSFVSLPATPLQEAEDLEQLKALESGAIIRVARVEETPLGVDLPEDLITLEALCRSNTCL